MKLKRIAQFFRKIGAPATLEDLGFVNLNRGAVGEDN